MLVHFVTAFLSTALIFSVASDKFKKWAFAYCSMLTTLVLNNGLVVIDKFAFAYCISLECIVVPPTIMTIKEEAFMECTQLRLVILQNVLNMIGSLAFACCSAMIESIEIPPSVMAISDDAFEHCSNLTRVGFCDMNEKFVSKRLMKYWWNQGVHKKCLSTYYFLVQCNIPMSTDNLTQNSGISIFITCSSAYPPLLTIICICILI